TGIVSLWPLRVPALGPSDVPGSVQQFGTEAALHLVQAAAAVGLPVAPRLWLATARTQVVDGTEAVCVEQAPVAGLVRVASSEHPDFAITLVDLDGRGSYAETRLL